MRRSASISFWVWIGITVLIAAQSSWILLRHGLPGFSAFMQEAPLTNVSVTLAAAACAWLLLGLLLWQLRGSRLDSENIAQWIGFYIVAFSYINILRERVRYGDIDYYIQAAQNLATNQPLPPTYLYPPLWATLLAPLAPLGGEAIFLICWFANLLALFLFFYLLQRTLQVYGFATPAAAAVTTIFLLINVPILRTLLYVQVNLHVMNFILLSLLWYPRRLALSAFAFALAVHLKASPLLLLLAFALEFDWRWMVWCALALIGLAVFTIALHGFSPWHDFIHNALLLTAPHELSLRDNSFDSAIGMTLTYFRGSFALAHALVYFAKGITLACCLVLAIRARAWVAAAAHGSRPLNAIVPLLLAMTLASPLVWEHHGVFIALPVLLLLRKLDSPSEWTIFGAIYFVEFLLPTFDYFPWSYARLIGMLTLLGLLWVTRGRGDNAFLKKLDVWTKALVPHIVPA